MQNYFRTLNATRQMHQLDQVAKGRRFVDKVALRKKMESALKRHHGIVAEANFIITTYNEGRENYEQFIG